LVCHPELTAAVYQNASCTLLGVNAHTGRVKLCSSNTLDFINIQNIRVRLYI
jgi:hypothetical protein